MNCHDAERLLDVHLDGQLSGSLRLEFEAHRLRCPRCRQTVALMEAATRVIASDRRTPGPADDFTDRVMARLPASTHGPSGPPWRRPAVLAIALTAQAAALLFAVAWLQWPAAERHAPDGGALVAGAPTDADIDRRVDRTEEVYDKAFAAVRNRVYAMLSEGRTIPQEWTDLVLLAGGLELSDEVVRRSNALGAGDPLSVLLQAMLPSGGDDDDEPQPTDGLHPL